MARFTPDDLLRIVDIDAPPDRVYQVLSDVERWPVWTSTMTSIRLLDEGPFQVGSRAKVLQPRLLPAVWVVTELHPPESFVWVTRSPGVKLEAGHRVETHGSGSRVTLTLRFSGSLGRVAALIFRRLIQQYIATEAEGLRKRCEAES